MSWKSVHRLTASTRGHRSMPRLQKLVIVGADEASTGSVFCCASTLSTKKSWPASQLAGPIIYASTYAPSKPAAATARKSVQDPYAGSSRRASGHRPVSTGRH
jgi:hypothetical protein